MAAVASERQIVRQQDAAGRELEVHQFVPSFAPRDAVGNHVLRTHQDLIAAGAEAAVWAGAVHPQLRRQAYTWSQFDDTRRTRGRRRALIYQAASYSGGLVEYLVDRSEPRIISYHNLTPPSFFSIYDRAAARDLRLASTELRRLAERTRVAVAASEFNAIDLRQMGVARVHVIPPYLGPGFRGRADRGTLARLSATRRGIDMVFVGRLVPNKGHAHLVRLVATVRAGIDPNARLFLIGAPGPKLYMNWLARMIDRLAPCGVVMTGGVSEAQLAAYYQHADVFVCTSSHEGFGVPLVEAMRADLPVLAYDSGAVGDTLGGAGILVRTRDPVVLAELVARIVVDSDLRDALCRRQRDRAAELERFPRGQALIAALAEATA